MRSNEYAKKCHLQKISRNPLSWILCTLFFLVQSCVGPRYTIGSDTPFYPPARELIDSLEYFKGFGDIDLLMDGEHNRAKIATRLTSGSQINAEIYSIFGGTVASMMAHGDSVHVDIGERSYTIARDEGLEHIAFLRKYPFTFKQFERIITGRALRTQLLVSPADSVWMEKNSLYYLWRTDSIEVILEGNRRRREVKRITYNALEGADWNLILNDLNRGVAREIKLYIGKDNYFNIQYDRLCLDPNGC
ncbi:MAG: hypothetical protein ACLFSB_05135 [Chitinispirillaceae bacterium]